MRNLLFTQKRSSATFSDLFIFCLFRTQHPSAIFMTAFKLRWTPNLFIYLVIPAKFVLTVFRSVGFSVSVSTTLSSWKLDAGDLAEVGIAQGGDKKTLTRIPAIKTSAGVSYERLNRSAAVCSRSASAQAHTLASRPKAEAAGRISNLRAKSTATLARTTSFTSSQIGIGKTRSNSSCLVSMS